MLDGHVKRADNVETVLEDQVINRRNRACGGVFDRQNTKGRLAPVHRVKDLLKGFDALQRGVGKELTRRVVAVGALDALIGDRDAADGGHLARMGDGVAQRLSAAYDVVLERARQLHQVRKQQPRRCAVFAALLLNLGEDLVFALLVENGNAAFFFVVADLLGAVHPALEQGYQLVVYRVDIGADLA